MAGLRSDQCFQIVGPAVDVAPVLAVINDLPWFGINYHIPEGADPNKPACDVVLSSKFPPVLHEFVAGLGLGGKTGRVILRRLPPHRGIPPHTDAWMPGESNWRRFQIPLVTHPDIRMRWPDDEVDIHLEVGRVYEVRYDRTHEVVNPTKVQRAHMQIDQVDATI